MFSQIFDAIEEWMRELLTGMITSNLDTMFTDVNQKTGEIATQVGQTPQGWNGSIFSMIRNLSDSVIMPIAGIIITFVLCYELISMLTERNNMHDIDTWMFFKYFVKMWIAVYLVSNTFTITMAVFDVGQHVVNSAAGVITGSTAIDISSALTDLSTTLESMEIGELVVLALETLIVGFCMKILSVLITATVMVLLMLPAFLFAMYEKDGMHLEDVLMHMIRVKFLRSPVRKYETENYYETDPEQIRQSPDTGKPKGGKTVAKKEK